MRCDRTIERGLLQHCQRTGVTVIAYSPFAKELSRIRDCDRGDVIDQIGQRHGKSPAAGGNGSSADSAAGSDDVVDAEVVDDSRETK